MDNKNGSNGEGEVVCERAQDRRLRPPQSPLLTKLSHMAETDIYQFETVFPRIFWLFGKISSSDSSCPPRMSDYTPIEPPSSTPTGTSPLQDLNEEQEEKRQKVLVHFSNDEYKIPGEEKGELTEEEKFWLVSDSYKTWDGLTL